MLLINPFLRTILMAKYFSKKGVFNVMAKQVPWNKELVELFSEKAMLSEEEHFIVETRAKGWSVSKQAQALNCSESTVHKRIALMKKKYDLIQRCDNRFPPRRESTKETWMDTH